MYTGAKRMPYSGPIHCLRHCIESDGVLGLYRGMGALALFSLPRFSLMFYANSWGRILGGKLEQTWTPSAKSLTAKTKKEFSTFQILAGGIISQAVVCPLIVNPLERAKVLMQTSPIFTGQFDCFQYILRSEGMKGLFRGTSLTLARDIPGFCTYFIFYENLRSRLKETDNLNVFTTAVIGGIAGMIAWSVSLPFDNLKNRHQVASGTQSIFLTLSILLN